MPDPEGAVILPRRRTGLRRLFGVALIAYGLLGIAIFALIALNVARPLERARNLTESVEEQRAALIDALDQAETTIDQMSDGVGGMQTSLGDARSATDRASIIATGVSTSMFQLRDSMMITIPILGGQPLAGLAGGFDNTGQQLSLLAQDLTAIGTALGTNSTDVATTAGDLRDLAAAVGDLTTAVRDGPTVDISIVTLDSVRYGMYAVAAWLALFAVGCVFAGLYMLFSRGRTTA